MVKDAATNVEGMTLHPSFTFASLLSLKRSTEGQTISISYPYFAKRSSITPFVCYPDGGANREFDTIEQLISPANANAI